MTKQSVQACSTLIDRIRTCENISSSEYNFDMEVRKFVRRQKGKSAQPSHYKESNILHDSSQHTQGTTGVDDGSLLRIGIGKSIHSLGIRRNARSNHTIIQITCSISDSHWAGWSISRNVKPCSRPICAVILYIPGSTLIFPHPFDPSSIPDYFPLHSDSVGSSKDKLHIPRSKEELAAQISETAPQRIQARIVMERPEQCFHCRDLQAEFEEVRAQQMALEDQVQNMEARHAEQIRNLEAKFDEQFRILHSKYRAEMNLFLHRVHTLHEQFNGLSNRCVHAEESLSILREIMEKKQKDNSSSSSAKPMEADQKPEDSTARKISRINID